MFRGANYWVADVVMLGISVALVGMIAKDAFVGCFREALSIGTSGAWAVVRGQLSHRGQVAPEGGEAAEPTEAEAAAALTAELQLALAKVAENEAWLAEKDARLAENEARLAENEAWLAEKDARLAENEARLAEKDALVASLSEQLGMDPAVRDCHQDTDQEEQQHTHEHEQLAAEDAQGQADVEAAPTAALPTTNRRGTFVQPLMDGEEKIYHSNGKISYKTADGTIVDEDEFFD